MRSASSFSGSQFDAFREYGKFVGKDGWTSCFEHPDRELRCEQKKPSMHILLIIIVLFCFID